jgi:hypothetical protein
MTCTDPKDIPQALLPAGISQKEEIEAMGTIEAHSFINKRPADKTLNLHWLIYLATRNWLQKEKMNTQWTK